MVSYCTECGGELNWDRKLRHYSCKSCGVTFNEAQLSSARDKLRDRDNTSDDDRKRRRHSEYLDWWTSSKKKE